MEFQQFRQHKHEITKSRIDLLMLANSFVSCRYHSWSLIPNTAEFGFEPPQVRSIGNCDGNRITNSCGDPASRDGASCPASEVPTNRFATS